MCTVAANNKQKKILVKFSETMRVCRAALISDSPPPVRHQPKLQDYGHGVSVSHGVPVYSHPSVRSSTKLYCLLKETHHMRQTKLASSLVNFWTH